MKQSQSTEKTPLHQGATLAIFTDQKGKIRRVNKAFCEYIGMDVDQLIKTDVMGLLHSSVPKVVYAQFMQAMRKNKVWTECLKLSVLDSRAKWCRVTVSPYSGQEGSFLWVFSTATEKEISKIEKRFGRIADGKVALKKNFIARKYKQLLDLPIGYKVGVSVTILTLVVAMSLILNSLYIVTEEVRNAEWQALQKYSEIVDNAIVSKGELATSLSVMLSAIPEVQQAVLNKDRTKLISMFKESYGKLGDGFGIRQFQFHLPPAISLLRLHKVSKWGDDLSGFRQTVVEANNTQKVVTGLEKGKAGYGIRGVAPINVDGKNIGSVEFGSLLSQQFFTDFKSRHGVEVGFFTLQGDKVTVAGSTFGTPEFLSSSQIEGVLSGGSDTREVALDGIPFDWYLRVLEDHSGNPAGVIVVGQDRTPYIQRLANIRNKEMLIAGVAIILSMLVSFFIARSISSPIVKASRLAENIARGVYDNKVELGSEDETGKLLSAMASMQSRLGYNIHEVNERNEENARIKVALDYISTNVTVSNAEGELIFMNNACMKLFDSLAKTQSDENSFKASDLIGTRLVDFFADDELNRIYGKPLSEQETVNYSVWGHVFKLVVNPVYNIQGEFQGRVTQWVDITAEVTVQGEIQRIVEAAQAGDLSQRISMAEKEGFFRTLAVGINALIEDVDRVIEDIANAMQRVAAGDLTKTIEAHYEGTFGSVKNSVNETIAGLEKMVRELRDASVEISGSANEILAGNDELSQRTEQQASSLETTAASMEEITGTVNQNANNAQAATTLAAEAQEVSQQGVEVVQDAIRAMGSINESSSKIEEIIHVIDEIAFQTNLLALNASVEAARAGEQGRGFAVVASEVRDLAGRSSNAAKQIKVLISDSVERVTNGSDLVNNAGDTLDAIASSISKVSAIMGEIALANQEQSTGIQQVNQAITQIDEATQQNTALAEQTSAVAISLRTQSSELDRMINNFTVSGSADHSSKPYLEAV